MKFFLIFFLISAFIYPQEKKESPLVEAAKKTGKYKFKDGIKITNDSLKVSPPKEVEVKESKEKPKEDFVLEEYKDSKGRTKEDWQKIMKEARENVSILEKKLKEMQSELNKLTNDYYAWDDVAYREGVIKPKMDKLREQIENTKVELEKAKNRLPELEEEARKSGALPGWLR